MDPNESKEKRKAERAKEMAEYFNNHVTLKYLIRWNSDAFYFLSRYTDSGSERASNAMEFLAGFGYNFISDLADAYSS